jgi:formylglycine-generating enzyme required for sulfatase activity
MPFGCKFFSIVISLSFLLSFATADDTPGLVKDKPSEGRFVETPQGFMVPYTIAVPGTKVAFDMVPIPGGTVRMGSPVSEAGHQPSEAPQFEVQLQPFWMGKYEVTWAEYKEYMGLYGVFKEFESQSIREVTDDNRVDAITAPTELYDPSFTFKKGENPRQPAVTMTQYAAKQYTKWVSAVTQQQYRLPTEAEWEYACRAGTNTAYSFGDNASDLGEYAWYFENSDETTHPVGGKKPNPWGLYDIHGNVSEWVLDQMLEDGYQRFGGKQVSDADAVVWPTKLFPRVVRGGNWDSMPAACRSASRLGSNDPKWKSKDPNIPLSPWWFTSDPARGVGFRMVRPLENVPREEMAKYWEADVDAIKEDVDIRLEEGRGVLGIVDKDLPEAMKQIEN